MRVTNTGSLGLGNIPRKNAEKNTIVFGMKWLLANKMSAIGK